MKHCLVLILFFICYALSAQNKLNIISSTQRIKVSVNNKTVNETPQAIVSFSNSLKDTVLLNITVEGVGTFTQTVFLLNKKEKTTNTEFSYLLNENNKSLTFLSAFKIDSTVYLKIPPKPIIDTSYKYSNNTLERFCEIKNDKPEYFYNVPKDGCTKPMPDSYSGYAVVILSKTQTPDQKYSVLENVFRNNCVSIKQTQFLLGFIDFEVERLKLLKFAYPSIVDKNNIELLNNSFKYEASKNELANFIKELKSKKNTIYNDCKTETDLSVTSLFIEQLRACSNDGERVLLFEKTHNNYCVSTETASKILNSFLHDREKIDCSKQLYFKCTDKQNYRKVAGVFSYKQSESELLDFIEKQNN